MEKSRDRAGTAQIINILRVGQGCWGARGSKIYLSVRSLGQLPQIELRHKMMKKKIILGLNLTLSLSDSMSSP